MPKSKASVTVHAATTPYTASAAAHVDGRFKFKHLEAGTYTVIVFVSGRGEVRSSVSVGVSTADRKRRVQVTIDTQSGALSRDRAHLVTARELAVPAGARREYAEALKRLSVRDIEGAVEHLERATAISPSFAAAWNHLGTIAYQTRRFEDAEAHFRRALHEDSDMYEPLVNLGGVLVTTGRFEDARRVNEQAVARKPGDPLAQAQIGMTYLLLNQLEFAEQHLLKAAELDPRHFSHPQLHLAEVYRRLNDTRSAVSQLESFLRHHPDDPEVPRIRELLNKWR